MPQRLSVDLGADTPLAPINVQFGGATTLSPDGTVVAFVGQEGESDGARLYVRRLDQLTAAPLSGTAGALAPDRGHEARHCTTPVTAGEAPAVTGGVPRREQACRSTGFVPPA